MADYSNIISDNSKILCKPAADYVAVHAGAFVGRG
jgi:hypothetical protein